MSNASCLRHSGRSASGNSLVEGVPYSANAVVTEYWDTPPKEANGDQWLIVTTIVEDPMYLNQPFITSSHFKKEADGG